MISLILMVFVVENKGNSFYMQYNRLQCKHPSEVDLASEVVLASEVDLATQV